MKAETLKKAILQYAMQGKLVEQNSEDEPASVLLERIKAEKEQLIKDGKIKKEKSLPPISEDEIPYELPKGWEWVRFQDITKVLTCGYASTPQYYEQGRIFLSAKNVKPYKFMPENHKFISEELYQTLIQNGKPEKDDILMTRVGAGIGESAIIDRDLDFAIYVSLTLIKLFKEDINPKYILHWLNSPYGTEKATKHTFGKGCSQGNLNVNQVRAFVIPIPPLAEQQRIVEELEQILPLIEEYGKNEEKLSKLNSTLPDKIKQSILQHAVQGKLVPQNPSDEPASELLKRIKAEKEQLIKNGKIKKEKPLPPITEDEIPFQIPDSWKWTKIRNIAFVTKLAGFEYTKYINLQDSGEIPVIRAQNVKPFSLNLANLKYIDTDTSEMLERSALTKPCLLMTFIGAGIGDVAIFDKNSRFHLAPNVAKIEFYNQHNNIDNRYAMYYLLSNYGKQEVFKFLKATAQPSLSMDTIREVMIPIPPLAEQQRIVTKVEELMGIIDNLKKG